MLLTCHFPCVTSINQRTLSFAIADFDWWVPGGFVSLLCNHSRTDDFTSRPQCYCTVHVQLSCGSVDMASHRIKITPQHNEWQATRPHIFSICCHCRTWYCTVNLEGNGETVDESAFFLTVESNLYLASFCITTVIIGHFTITTKILARSLGNFRFNLTNWSQFFMRLSDPALDDEFRHNIFKVESRSDSRVDPQTTLAMLWRNLSSITNCQIVHSYLLTRRINYKFMCLSA